MEHLQPLFGYMKAHWTADEALPGGDMPNADLAEFHRIFQQRHAWLPVALAARYARTYGTRSARLLDGIHDVAGLGQLFGADLYEAEVRYLMRNEWALTADDILWRRSKLGLRLDASEVARLTAWLESQQAQAAPQPATMLA
ncbi:glycerol-3-phosphate dehydrogenase domain protein [Collimonas arenae]|nr:glycerol-3-phosphate dehydrogenase domain protein [Collimonas arenae]